MATLSVDLGVCSAIDVPEGTRADDSTQSLEMLPPKCPGGDISAAAEPLETEGARELRQEYCRPDLEHGPAMLDTAITDLHASLEDDVRTNIQCILSAMSHIRFSA